VSHLTQNFQNWGFVPPYALSSPKIFQNVKNFKKPNILACHNSKPQIFKKSKNSNMDEVIQNVTYVENYELDESKTNIIIRGYVRKVKWNGYIITTDKQQIMIMMETWHFCCEENGLLLYFDERIPDIKQMDCSERFFRHRFNNIKRDSSLFETLIGLHIKQMGFSNQKAREEFGEPNGGPILDDSNSGYVYFNITLTDERKIQLYAWNEHNGYYPHELYIKWNDREEIQKL